MDRATKASAKVAQLTDEEREKQMTLSELDPITATQILTVNSRAFAMDRIPLALSQRVYGAISPIGWKSGVSLAERLMILTLAQCLVEMEIKRRGN